MLIISDELIENSRFAYLVFERLDDKAGIELEFSNPAARRLLNFERITNSSLEYLSSVNSYIKQLEELLLKFLASESAYKRYTVKFSRDFYTAHFTQLSKRRVLLELVKEFQHDLSETTHELKRPIQNIKTLTETLLRGAKDDPLSSRRFLNSINDEVDRLADMVQNLLKLGAIDSVEGAVSFTEIDMSYLVESEVNNIREKAKEKYLTIRLDIEPAINLHGDRDLVTHLVANLLDNAVKYNVEDGFIEVVLGKQSLRVINSTNAVKEADLSKLFSKFYRSTNSNGVKGSGLGLAIVQKIADVHGWRLSVNIIENAAEPSLEQSCFEVRVDFTNSLLV